MSRWRDSSFVRWWRAPAPWGACLLLVLLAFAWRMPYAATSPIVQVDEVKYSLPTVHRLLAGDAVFYISGTDYGAPIEQAAAAVLFRIFGESASAFRIPTVLLGSLAVGVFFLALRRTVGTAAAFGIALPLALANSSIARYTTFSHGSYATLLLVVGLIQLATMRGDEKRTAARWLVLGVLMGTGMYVLKLAIFQVFASLAWLWLRSDYFQRFSERLSDAYLRQRMLAGICTVAAGLFVLAPVLYHYLTRRATYAISPLEIWFAAPAAFLCLAGALIVVPTLCAPRLREWTPAIGALALVVLIPLPAALWFRQVELPRLAARGIEPYAEASYSLKHLHEWPNQARLIVEGVLPAVIIGRWDEVRGFEENETLGWKSAVTAALLVALAFADFRRWKSGRRRPVLRSADFIFIVPFILTLAVLFPSWSLHSESSFRYLLPFLPGMFLIAYRCLEDRLAAHPRIAAALLALYAAYCAFDCFQHIA